MGRVSGYSSLSVALNLCTISLVLAQLGDQFAFNGFREAKLQIMVDGSARILPDGLLQLTNTSLQHQTGHAFYHQPFNFGRSLSFSTEFVFSISPFLGANRSGHGIAFTIASSIDFFRYASSSGLLGLFNGTNNGKPSNHVIAIEFDTVNNGDWLDADNNHVGIDVNSVMSLEAAPAVYFSDEKAKNISLVLASGNPIRVWVDYNEHEMLLNVTLAPHGMQKPTMPLLSTYTNLSDIFKATMYVGFSASIGTLVSDQYILGWSFNKDGEARSLDISKLPLPPLPPLPPSPQPPTPSQSHKQQLQITVPLLFVAFTIVVSGVSYICWIKKYGEVLEDWEKDYGPQRFLYRSLYKATKGFNDSELLGSGGFGKVYRGEHRSKGLIAVKRISHDAEQGIKEFVAEIVSMGRLRHRSLVPLLGYCRQKRELLLVYEYMPNGSLDNFLYGKESRRLDWKQRFHIIRGVASAILYLHEEWEQVVLHRDIKASNVLLDADLNGHLGDFGLARFHDHGTNLQTTRVVGTVGYMAPELATTGVATTSTDVYAFGAFVLEVVCGRRPIDPEKPRNETVLVKWLVDCGTRGSLKDTIDPKLEQDYDPDEVELVLKLALLCCQCDPAFRPSMRELINYLENSFVLPDMNIGGAIFEMPRLRSREGSATTLAFPSSASFGFDTYTIMFQGR